MLWLLVVMWSGSTVLQRSGVSSRALVNVEGIPDVVEGWMISPANPSKRKISVTDCSGAQKLRTQAKTAAPPPPEVIEIDDEDALPRKRGKRGPKSDNRLHFHEPVAIIGDSGEKRGGFDTRIAGGIFDDEPKLGNLATHGHVPVPDDAQRGPTRGISASSAKIMEAFLREGKLNRVYSVNLTQSIMKLWAVSAQNNDPKPRVTALMNRNNMQLHVPAAALHPRKHFSPLEHLEGIRGGRMHNGSHGDSNWVMSVIEE
ncbi:hypothetical protein C8R45DRAFT_946042 [Mycena sanguinolenta]|nr:hypothetical protein C8R45DRAFT_946042 [Mycena sanguinolenta]